MHERTCEVFFLQQIHILEEYVLKDTLRLLVRAKPCNGPTVGNALIFQKSLEQ